MADMSDDPRAAKYHTFPPKKPEPLTHEEADAFRQRMLNDEVDMAAGDLEMTWRLLTEWDVSHKIVGDVDPRKTMDGLWGALGVSGVGAIMMLVLSSFSPSWITYGLAGMLWVLFFTIMFRMYRHIKRGAPKEPAP